MRIFSLLFALGALLASGAQASTPVQSVETLGNEAFDVWHAPGDGFKVVCRQPCEADPAGIREYYQGFRTLLPELIDFHGVDVIEECVFHAMPVTDSTPCRSPIPRHAGRGVGG